MGHDSSFGISFAYIPYIHFRTEHLKPISYTAFQKGFYLPPHNQTGKIG